MIISNADMQHAPVPRHSMQTNRLLTLGLALLGLMAAASQIHAQTVTTILTMTNTTWRYYQGTNAPPNVNNIVWSQTNYSDAAWPQGFGGFGIDPDFGPAGRVVPGFDFRTPLNLTQP